MNFDILKNVNVSVKTKRYLNTYKGPVFRITPYYVSIWCEGTLGGIDSDLQFEYVYDEGKELYCTIVTIPNWHISEFNICKYSESTEITERYFENIVHNMFVKILGLDRGNLTKHEARVNLLDNKDKMILNLLKDQGGSKTRDIAKNIKLSPRATRTRLSSLLDRNLIYQISSSSNDPTRLYFLKEDGSRRINGEGGES